MLNIALSAILLLSLSATGKSENCPEFTTEHGATWISVDWEICEDKEPEEVLLYRLDLTDLSLNLHNSSENKFCPDRECSRNMTLLMPCLNYSVSITLVTNDENSTV